MAYGDILSDGTKLETPPPISYPGPIIYHCNNILAGEAVKKRFYHYEQNPREMARHQGGHNPPPLFTCAVAGTEMGEPVYHQVR
jgi:hypothetical protein